jgi:hypothetical protein
MVVAANGARLAPVYRVGPDGSAQIILEGKLVTIPATTLSMSGGKLTTSLTKSEVLALHWIRARGALCCDCRQPRTAAEVGI